jgi:phosphatidylglycerophosphatase A
MRPRLALVLAVATCLGAGYVPVAPGTAGSALALPIAWGVYRLAGIWGVGAAVVIATLSGLWASALAEKHYGEHDSSHIVVDELAGQLVSVLPVPSRWPYLVVAFGWFRLFDSVKPWPAGWVDRNVGGGGGVMLDDLVAGVYSAAVTALLVHTGVVDRVLSWLLP